MLFLKNPRTDYNDNLTEYISHKELQKIFISCSTSKIVTKFSILSHGLNSAILYGNVLWIAPYKLYLFKKYVFRRLTYTFAFLKILYPKNQIFDSKCQKSEFFPKNHHFANMAKLRPPITTMGFYLPQTNYILLNSPFSVD